MDSAVPGDPLAAELRNTDRASRDLASRLRDREGSALIELYEREEKRAFALAYRVTGDAAAAEDAVQEAFTQLWDRSHRIETDGRRVESLLMTIVYRRAIDQVRRGERGASPLPDPDILEHIDERATEMLERIEESVSSAALRVRLQEALASLPPEQRSIVESAYAGQRSLREIAEEESVPIGTVKSRLRLGMAKLTKVLRGQEEQ